MWNWWKKGYSAPDEPSRDECRAALMALLAQVEQGMTWEQAQPFLQNQGVTSQHLAQWLERHGGDLVREPDLRTGQQLLKLSQITEGDLSKFSKLIGNAIVQKLSQPVVNRPELSGDTTGLDASSSLDKQSSTHGAADEGQTGSNNQQASASDDAVRYFDQGNQFFLSGRYEEAIASYDQALKVKPDFHDAWYNRGNALVSLGRYEEAIASCDQALKVKPDFHDAWANRGFALLKLGREEEAIASYDQALKVKPDFHAAWANRGNALVSLGRYEEAIASYDQALKVKPDFHEAWNNRGFALEYLGRYEEAIASCDQALKVKPDFHDAWNNRGKALGKLGRYEEAIVSYDQALKVKPDFHDAWYNRGSALGKIGREEEAIVSYDQALKVKPDDHDAWANRGLALLKLGREEEAIASYDQVLKVKPDDHEAWNNRGVALGKLGRYEEAIASCDQVLKVKPDVHHAWNNRGVALGKLGRYEEAIASYDQALKVKPDYHDAWTNRGVAAQQSPGYDCQANQRLVDGLTFSSINERQRLLAGFNLVDDEILLTTLLANPVPLWVQFENVEPLYHFIQQPASPALQALIQQELSLSLVQFIQTTSSPQLVQYLQQKIHLPESLNERGYQGALNSYQAELGEQSQDEPRKAICKDTHPEGWGILHRTVAQTHYQEGRRQKYPDKCWRRAEHHFKRALETLRPPDFDELYLDVLQELIQVLTDLDEYDAARKLNQEGRDWIELWLQEPNRDADQKKRLGLQQARFTQHTVDFALQQGNIFEAFQQAEFAKNVCLRWLLDLGDVPEITFEQTQSLLSPNTAAIYWHLNPVALTTFLLLPEADTPILIPPPSRTSSDDEADQRSLHLHQLLDWETWLKQWNQQYDSYGSSKDKTDTPQVLQAWRQQHPWRIGLEDNLDKLSALLNILAIHAQLPDAIENLILIPHRDLHRFPLHIFFETYSSRYLPSAQVGLDQITQPDQSVLNQLFIVENPKSEDDSSMDKKLKSLADLPYAEVEAAWLRALFRHTQTDPPAIVTTLPNTDANREALIAALQQPAQLFHFTGHGSYDSQNPAQSCLFLSDSEFTLIDIVHHIDLSGYRLACLAACETAVSGNQTIIDEYVGLTSACLKAGVGSVLSTLWRVESASSMIFIIQFYQALQSGQTAAVALQIAQRYVRNATYTDLIELLEQGIQLLESQEPAQAIALEDARNDLIANQQTASRIGASQIPYRDPYYWAAFTISGQ